MHGKNRLTHYTSKSTLKGLSLDRVSTLEVCKMFLMLDCMHTNKTAQLKVETSVLTGPLIGYRALGNRIKFGFHVFRSKTVCPTDVWTTQP